MRRRIELLVAAAVPAIRLDGLAGPTESPLQRPRGIPPLAESVPLVPVTAECESSIVSPAMWSHEASLRLLSRNRKEATTAAGCMARYRPGARKEQWDAS